jgi:hypothetical protein
MLAKYLTSLVLCFLNSASHSPGQGTSAPWVLKPGGVTRGLASGTWRLDLRNKPAARGSSEAAQLSSRVYGPGEGDLHQSLVLKVHFPTGKVFAFHLSAVSRKGSDLVIHTNATLAGRLDWPPASDTHRPHCTFYLPSPAGPVTVRLEVTRRNGVVATDRYLFVDGIEQLPQDPPPRPIASAQATTVVQTPSVLRAHASPGANGKLEADDGYRGVWYCNQPTQDEYKYKYSGGFATYPQQHAPIAIYCKAVNKTFFVYGGTTARSATDRQELLHMVSYYDHATGLVPRPRILLNKQTGDAHDNPTLQVDDRGHLWVFSSSHGTSRPSYIHRSVRPYDIDEFECVLVTNFSYTQPWFVSGKGFLFLHTRYGGGRDLGIDAARCLFWMTSPDGRQWTPPQMLAGIDRGDYQISWQLSDRVATAFDFHPSPVGLNARANVYYLETGDLGVRWQTVRGERVNLPLTQTENPALAYDSRAERLLVYLKDLNFDRAGRPVILFLTSKGFEPGPRQGPRQWHTLRWTGREWVRRPVTTSDNNYDHGSLYIEADGTWRIIAPTQTGPQPYNPGGEMVMWTSSDEGLTWKLQKQLTRNSPRNHTYARRPVNAHPDFYALWADGHARQPSESFLYFTNQRGDRVWRLPEKMTTEFAKPIPVW